jgi:hypothetical protein
MYMRSKLLLIAVVLLAAPMAFAGTYSLNDWCFYVNSLDVNHSCASGSGVDNFSPSISLGSFDYQHLTDNNLGSVSVTLGSGSHSVFAIFNYDVAPGGGSNDYANAVGNLANGQSYSVNTEGTAGSAGGLYSQFASGNLDNTNHLSSCTGSSCPDVAVSIGYNSVNVPEGSSGTVTFTVGNAPPASGFYVQQTDNSGGGSVYVSSNVQIDGGLNAQISAVPEPGMAGLTAGGMGLLLWFVRRRRNA